MIYWPAGSKLEALILSDDFKVVMDTVREFNAARGNIFSLNALARVSIVLSVPRDGQPDYKLNGYYLTAKAVNPA